MISGINIQRTLRRASSYDLIGLENYYDNQFSKLVRQSTSSTNRHSQVRIPFNKVDKENGLRAGFRTDGWVQNSQVLLHLSMLNSHCQAGTLCQGTIQIEDKKGIQLEYVKVALLGVEETVGKLTPYRKGFLLQKGTIHNYDSIIYNQQNNHPFISMDFQIQLNADLPSSLIHPWASIRYVLFCEVAYKPLGKSTIISTGTYRNVLVVETIRKETLVNWLTTCVLGELNFQPNLFTINNQDGLFRVIVKLTKKAWLAGSPITIGFLGSNLSGKRVTKIKLKLLRNIMVFNESNLAAPLHTITTKLTQASFKDTTILDGFDTNEFDLALALDTPPAARTITNARHLSVTYTIHVTLHTKLGSTVKLELPLILLHPSSAHQTPNKLRAL